MSKMSKKFNVWLYSENLKDFINNDLKIIKKRNVYLFVSKKEDFTFKTLYYASPRGINGVLLFATADEIFSEIINERENEEF